MRELYGFFRSSAAFRVRIALALKGLPYDYKPVHLRKNEQMAPAYTALAPSALVPTLNEDGQMLTQSLAIMEYLEEVYPNPPLLPPDALGRARVRALALDIACEIHPLNNLRVLRYLAGPLKLAEPERDTWYRHWVETGLAAVERQLQAKPSRFCHGEMPGLADCCLVPQIFNAHRLNCNLSHVPNVVRVHEACMQLPAFENSRPEACPDAE